MCVFSKIRSELPPDGPLKGGRQTTGPSRRTPSGGCNLNFTTKKAHVTTLFNSNSREGSPSPGSVGKKSSTGPSLVQRTSALLGGLDLILEHHDAGSRIREALKVQCHSYLDTSLTEKIWLKRCKYLLSYPLARFLKNDLPPSPDCVFKPAGPLRKWMKARLNAFNPKNVHLWYSWFQAKRSTLPLSDSIVNETYDDHFKTLTSPDLGEEDIIEKIFQNYEFQTVLLKLKSGILRNFDKNSYIQEMPKQSACFEGKRKTGGQLDSLRDMVGLKSFNSLSKDLRRSGVVEIIPPEFHSMEYRPWVYSRQGTRTNFVQTRFCAYGREEWNSTIPALAKKLVPTVPLSCTIQAVLEPNKIRVISKGNALPYYTCKGLQLCMHSLLKKIPCFRLIGRPLTALDIHDIAAHVPNPRPDLSDYVWNSVDYSAATDGLSWKYSSRILKVLLSELPMEDQLNYFNVLGPHVLHYPNKGEVDERGLQRNGQLMGSILSFIILCLANLGVFLHSVDLAGYNSKHILENVLINGDDMVYAYPKIVYNANVSIGKSVGLEMSVGKAYNHREYLNINSQSVLYPLHKEVELRKLKWVNYLNTGLFFGRHKVQGRKDDGKQKTADHHTKVKEGITPNLNCLLQGALPGKEHALLKKSLEVHKETINKECMALSHRKTPLKRNLFVPQVLGGMGIRAPEGWKFFLSKQDLHVANGIISSVPDLPFALERPLPGEPATILEDWKVTPWEDREQKDDSEEMRFPLKRIDYKALKTYCRSPDFEFYIPNRSAQIVKTERPKPPRKAKYLHLDKDSLVNYDFHLALFEADPDLTNDFVKDTEDFFDKIKEERLNLLEAVNPLPVANGGADRMNAGMVHELPPDIRNKQGVNCFRKLFESQDGEDLESL